MNPIAQFPCPSCGATYTKATSTVKTERGEMRRKRSCMSCAKGFVTYEVTADEFALLQTLRKWMSSELFKRGVE